MHSPRTALSVVSVTGIGEVSHLMLSFLIDYSVIIKEGHLEVIVSRPTDRLRGIGVLDRMIVHYRAGRSIV